MKRKDLHTPVKLPDFLKPIPGYPLVRVGRDNDGGYLIDQLNLVHSDLLVSMGINDDWSFEAQFCAETKVPLLAYDGSVSNWDFFIEFYKRVALFEPTNARRAFQTWRAFAQFFRGPNRRHIAEFIGGNDTDRQTSFKTILSRDMVSSASAIFFKIDIELSEYQILEDLIAFGDRIEGLAIEFHDIDRKMDQLENFVRKFSLNLCHVHANNSSVVLADGLPATIECSFSRHNPASSARLELPHPLDMPCQAHKPELAISFT